MNSLLHLKCQGAEQWFHLFVRYFENFLEGSKDPDTRFKDFRNHVIHVSENYWGGAVSQAEEWYGITVEHLRNQQWQDAVYSAGVLSHYYMDPIMPLHTGQTEEEGVIHRACEWSINKSFKNLIERLETTTGYPSVDLPSGHDWLKQAVHQGAEQGHLHYQTFIDHYHLELGVKDPPAGLDETLRDITAQLLGYASVGFARILERAFEEATVQPAATSSSLWAWFYRLTAPFAWVFQAFCHVRDRRQVRKVANEFQATGKVVRALPRDDQQIRQLHATEVLKVELAELDAQEIKLVGSQSTATSSPRAPMCSKRRNRRKENAKRERGTQHTFRLHRNSTLEDAPSIGPKTAGRFEKVDIRTVGDLLEADPEQTASQLDSRHISADVIRRWQTQAKLACLIPGIYGHDAQILAACGFETPSEIADAEPAVILSLVDEFVKTEDAKFVLRSSKRPDLNEVSNWVTWAKQSRHLDAA